MSFLWAIIVGFVLGLLAKGILPGKQAIPLWLTVVLGTLGGILGNAVAIWSGVGETRGVDWIRHILQIAGAVLLVAVGTPLYHSWKGGSRGRVVR
ncbi:GlsB/YeaQ/YmgE family stress response membrane protein [Wenjunlia tyrosinilytica]|uniref:Signal peptidase n=1 Tax=Wenjunlia tyrosinilytica TaxID=1544741 RepID=A0A918DS14_9ACTN|nr:GlsB/YeaQ/YmgE family stress response membrane protein [Wenjunlia tyrosinilytica]GGO81191.1 signal peptidase [Wenjunlia tyrosinilytica]